MVMVPLKLRSGRPVPAWTLAWALLLTAPPPPPPPVQAARVTPASPIVDTPTTERRNIAARVGRAFEVGLFHMGHTPFYWVFTWGLSKSWQITSSRRRWPCRR